MLRTCECLSGAGPPHTEQVKTDPGSILALSVPGDGLTYYLVGAACVLPLQVVAGQPGCVVVDLCDHKAAQMKFLPGLLRAAEDGYYAVIGTSHCLQGCMPCSQVFRPISATEYKSDLITCQDRMDQAGVTARSQKLNRPAGWHAR